MVLFSLFFKGLAHFFLFLLLKELFFADHAALLHIVALVNFTLPEILYRFQLVLLLGLKVGRDLIQIESAILLVTVCHVLLLVFVLEVLELEVGDRTRSEVQGQAGLVTLVHKVPNVDSVGLRDENDSRSGRAEGTTGVMRPKSVR